MADPTKGLNMKYLRYLALLGALVLPLSYSQAQVRIGIGIGLGGYAPGYVSGPPSCPYGYYPDYPYGCAPYGYYSPSYFVNGIFIGAGPWYHGYSQNYYRRPVYSYNYYNRNYYDRGYARGYDRDDSRRYFDRHDYRRDNDNDDRHYRGGERN